MLYLNTSSSSIYNLVLYPVLYWAVNDIYAQIDSIQSLTNLQYIPTL